MLNSGDQAVTTLGGVLGGLTGSQAIAVINAALSPVLSLLPISLDGILGLTASHIGFPALNVDPGSVKSGLYEGTMTFTFTQL